MGSRRKGVELVRASVVERVESEKMVTSDNADAPASLGLAPALSAYWIEQVLAELEPGPMPRLWPGTKLEARELAAVYFDDPDEVEWLASRVQRIALAAWPKLTRHDGATEKSDLADEDDSITIDLDFSDS